MLFIEDFCGALLKTLLPRESIQQTKLRALTERIKGEYKKIQLLSVLANLFSQYE
jgi:hypothetical protein